MDVRMRLRNLSNPLPRLDTPWGLPCSRTPLFGPHPFGSIIIALFNLATYGVRHEICQIKAGVVGKGVDMDIPKGDVINGDLGKWK